MDLTLRRKFIDSSGVFGALEAGPQIIAYTLEHAYQAGPKLPAGIYTCVRGPHRLHGMTADFETFEVTGVPGHTGILFHWGNFNADSDGCILLGSAIVPYQAGHMVTNSKSEFALFMQAQVGVDEFLLIVQDVVL